MTVPDVSADLEAAAQRVKELSDKVTEQAKENGLAWLEGYEKVLKNMLDLEEQAAKGTGLDWATTLATTHANFVRETSEVVLRGDRQAAQELTPRVDPVGLPRPTGSVQVPRSTIARAGSRHVHRSKKETA